MTAARHDFQMDQGATFRRVLILKQSDGTLMSLSNWTGAAKMRARHDSPQAAAEFTVTVNPGLSTITMELSASQTGALTPGRYVYDLETDDHNGTVLRMIEGVITVRPEVTR